MLALAHHYNELVTSPAGLAYRVRVYGQAQADGMWGGWIVFFPVGGGRVIATDRQTTQSSLANLTYWASGLTFYELHAALERAIDLQPEAQLALELERLDALETSAAKRAETLEAQASAARAEADAAEIARERTEERLLGSVAEGAELDADLHKQAAARLEEEAQAADRALRARRKTKRSKK